MVSGSLSKEVFGPGAKEIGDIVQEFDFSQMNVGNNSTEDWLQTNLAPSYGSLSQETLEMLHNDVKIIISGVMRTLAKDRQKTWNSVVANMMQNPLLEPDYQTIEKSDMLIKEDTAAFSFDGSHDAAIVQEVNAWFTTLIGDDDVLKCIKFDAPVMANILSQSGAQISSFLESSDSERHSKRMVDITVLGFPELDRPQFKLFRVQLEAWTDSSSSLTIGITGNFSCRKFNPRQSILNTLNERTRSAAVHEASNLFA